MANYPPLHLVGAAIFSRLNGDSTLTTMAPVVNDAKEDQAFPYLLVGRPTARGWNTLGGASAGFGWEVEVMVAAYSRYQGDKQALQIIERATELLNYYDLTITGYTTAFCLLDPDQSPAPIALKVEYPNKVEQRVNTARFTVRVH